VPFSMAPKTAGIVTLFWYSIGGVQEAKTGSD
jgi:hypothetical protein